MTRRNGYGNMKNRGGGSYSIERREKGGGE